MERVLSLPELLESIFVHLDMTTLLVCVQRVNKTWNKTIACSPTLQQKLFFRTITDEELPAFSAQLMNEVDLASSNKSGPESKLTKLVLNPLLVKKFNSCFFDFGPTFGCARGYECFHTLPWTPHPRKVISLKLSQSYQDYYHHIQVPEELDEPSSRWEETCRARFTTRGASWRRMLVSQPAPPGIGIVSNESHRKVGGANYIVGEAFIPAVTTKGVQMGQLYDLVQYHAGHHVSQFNGFRVTWEHPHPFSCKKLEENMRQLLRQTTLIVLFDSEDFGLIRRQPENVADFDSTFRCDEFFLPHFYMKMSGPSCNAEEKTAPGDVHPSAMPLVIWLRGQHEEYITSGKLL